ncbi:MAG: DnaJ domain-containing protein [Gammaproteobacteria bacterium]|nr:DnaJ domain-containing protein [Gammaproteobacteria bacterium]
MHHDQAYPLSWPAGWPRTQAHQRKRAAFGKKNDRGWKQELSIAQAIKRLRDELALMTPIGNPYRVVPADIIISSNMPVRKTDGMPMSGRAAPDDPGVAVYFDLDGVPHCLPCDKWDRVADNIAAVAAHIGALRGIERWGVGDIAKAFTGYQALPGPGVVQAKRHWRDVLDAHDCSTIDEVKKQYRIKVQKHHPDRGGEHDLFNEIQQAWNEAQEAI